MKTLLATVITVLSIRAGATIVLGDAPTNTVIAVASDLAVLRTEAAAYSWVTNTASGSSTVTIVNDAQKPHRVNGYGSTPTATPAIAFAGLGSAAILLEVNNCASVSFPAGSMVFGGTFQTNRVNCFAVWTGPTGTPFVNLLYAY